jgi:RNA polymerase-binding transcription factor DksA
MQALDKILEAVVGNCQETESPIPFNDLPSLGDVE